MAVFWKVKAIYRPDGAKWGPEMLEKRAKVGRLRIRVVSASGARNCRLLNEREVDVLPLLTSPHISGAEDHGIMIRGSQQIWEDGGRTIQQAWWCEPINPPGLCFHNPAELQTALETEP